MKALDTIKLVLGCSLLISCQSIPYISETKNKITIIYTDQDQLQASNIFNTMQTKYTEIADLLNPQYDKSVTIRIYPDLSSFNSARSSLGMSPGKPNGGNAVGTTRIMLVSSSYYDVATHEFTHLVINSFAGKPQNNSWIDESICYYLAGQEYGSISYLKNFYKENNYFQAFSQNTYYVKTLYYMGEYIFETYSINQIRKLLRTRSVNSALGVSTKEYLT